MTIASVSAGQTIDPAWGNSVATQLNDLPLQLQSNQESITTDASGYDTITLPEAFADALYHVVVTVFTTSGYFCTVTARTSSTFDVRMHDSSGPVASTTRTITWIAVGDSA